VSGPVSGIADWRYEQFVPQAKLSPQRKRPEVDRRFLTPCLISYSAKCLSFIELTGSFAGPANRILRRRPQRAKMSRRHRNQRDSRERHSNLLCCNSHAGVANMKESQLSGLTAANTVAVSSCRRESDLLFHHKRVEGDRTRRRFLSPALDLFDRIELRNRGRNCGPRSVAYRCAPFR
jgi:hypothetical protein